MDWTAIATFVLATVTTLLVIATHGLARRMVEETQAQWRPILLIRYGRVVRDLDGYALLVETENVGRGPAVGLSPLLDAGGGVAGRVPGTGPLVVAPNESADFEFGLLEEDVTHTRPLRFVYNDISGAGYTTGCAITLPRPKSSGEPADVELSHSVFHAHPPITFWWMNVIPRPFRACFWPLNRRILRRRGFEV